MNKAFMTVLLLFAGAQSAAQSPQIGPQSHMPVELESAFRDLLSWTKGFASVPHTAGLEYFQVQTLSGTSNLKSKKCHLAVFHSKTSGVRKAQFVFAESESLKIGEAFGAWSLEPESANSVSILLEVGETGDSHLFWSDDRPTTLSATPQSISIRQDSNNGNVQTLVLSLGENRRPTQVVATSEQNRKLHFTRTCRF